MNLKQKLQTETINEPVIWLHKEGVFWKAYEYSAFRFVQEIRAYKVQKKYMRTVKQEVTSLGFPDNHLMTILTGKEFEQTDDIRISVKADHTYDAESFTAWKSEVPSIDNEILNVLTADKEKNTGLTNVERNVIDQLQTFSVETSTPLKCLLFISDLKHQLTHQSITKEIIQSDDIR